MRVQTTRKTRRRSGLGAGPDNKVTRGRSGCRSEQERSTTRPVRGARGLGGLVRTS